MVERKEYLDQLWAWKDERQIKVVTGIRRCGKSVLLEQYQQKLLASGVTSEQIISINFENLDYEPLKDYMKLYNYLKERLCADKMTYIFLDEVQEVPSFEKVVDSLYIRDNVDIYITGSNAYMLSSELATLLSGRYTEIKMLPLSFREYMSVTGMAKEEAFAEFMKTGGIPYVAVMNRTDEKIDQYLEGIYNTVIVKDIEQRQARREKESGRRKITDIALLKTIARYLASVVGSPVSMKSITNYLTSSGRKVSQNTVSDYVEALTESFVFYPVERFDIVGKQLLKINNKFYIVDMGIRNHILPRKRYDLGFTIENIVYLELLRRGYHVTVGKNQDKEIDFVCDKRGEKLYIQVTYLLASEETIQREFGVYDTIRDNFPKYVVSMDEFDMSRNGIKHRNIRDFLLDENWE